MMRHVSFLSVAGLCIVLSPLFSQEPLPSPTAKIVDRNRAPANGVWDKNAGTERGLFPEFKTRRLDRTIDGWSVVDGPNFRVFHKQKVEFAEKAIQAAERARISAERRWFGAVDDDWSPRCEIYLHETSEDFSQATGAPANVPGYTTTYAEDNRVISRRIDLCCKDPNLLKAVLPHETTHAVLAGRFGRYQIPRWANEGMAVLEEPKEKIEKHLERLARYRKAGELFPAEELLRLSEYPEKRVLGVFYAESVSLVDFLTKERGPKVFYRFMRDGLTEGYTKAFRRNYGWDISELDDRWREFAFGKN